jgi:hypothetical protein
MSQTQVLLSERSRPLNLKCRSNQSLATVTRGTAEEAMPNFTPESFLSSRWMRYLDRNVSRPPGGRWPNMASQRK